MIREVKLEDANQIAEIYNYYIINSIATFEEVSVDGLEMKSRISSIYRNFPWLVFEENETILGYAYANYWNSRCAYDRSVETSVYLRKNVQANGIGSALYEALIDRLKKLHYHAIIGGVSLPNPASVALHEKFGYKKVAQFIEVGYKFEKWIDVGYWQLILS